MKTLVVKSKATLIKDGTILYPTDTVYGIGCDATSESAVKKIYKIKQREESKSLIILVHSFDMLKKYVEEIPEQIKDYLKNTKKPTTVIYNNPKNLAKNVIANNNTVAIRIVNKGFIKDLLTAFNKPIVSTSANISSKPTPMSFGSISKIIINSVDFVVSLPNQSKDIKPSNIIQLVNQKIEFIRK
ncbi:MAG: threonylcarbamoyl-AMP synthase [Flavobacteriaceae bacterium]|nr:threonylcarbamoyl-AMP synthase [Flavobacteriaceae bacterium]